MSDGRCVNEIAFHGEIKCPPLHRLAWLVR